MNGRLVLTAVVVGAMGILSARANPLTDLLLRGPKGTAAGGPGAGKGGVLIVDIPGDAAASTIAALEENIANLTGTVSDLSGKGPQSHVGLTDEVLKGIGQPAAGMAVDPYVLKFDPAILEARQLALQQLRAQTDGARYQPFILYLEALQAHDARLLAYVQRVNALIAVNNGKLNYQQRVRLAAEMGLLQGQLTIADQEVRDAANRATVAGTLERMQDAQDELRTKARASEVNAMLGAP
ncbi:MAG: hypothetical protein PHE83_14995 [Opitutaceae bacterium]|nr:hypothetical protein [Opitutaceae bacterium]